MLEVLIKGEKWGKCGKFGKYEFRWEFFVCFRGKTKGMLSLKLLVGKSALAEGLGVD